MQSEAVAQLAQLDTTTEKRKYLAQISRGIKKLVELEQFESVNEGLLSFYLEDLPEGTFFNSYRGWRKQGYQVKKGSRAFLIWGSPRKAKSTRAEKDEDEFKFYPLAYVFSSEQVEPLSDGK